MEIRRVTHDLLMVGLLTAGIALPLAAQPSITGPQDSALTLGSMQDSLPWSKYDNEHWHGLYIAIYGAIFGYLDVPLTIIPFNNYPRIFSELAAGNLDISANFRIGDKPLRINDSMVCTEEFFSSSSWGAYTLKGNDAPRVSQPEDLARYKVAIIRGLDTRHLPKFNDELLTQLSEPNQLLMMLRSKRVDFVIIPQEITEPWKADFGVDTQEAMHLGDYFAHLCFSKRSLGGARAMELNEQVDRYLKSERELDTH